MSINIDELSSISSKFLKFHHMTSSEGKFNLYLYKANKQKRRPDPPTTLIYIYEMMQLTNHSLHGGFSFENLWGMFTAFHVKLSEI